MLQNSAMMCLGLFVFMRQTVPYQETSRELSWNRPTNSVVGKLPRTQFTGKASETMTISGTLIPELTGGRLSLTALELMAEQGKPYPLIDGATFMVLGWFVIENISVQSSLFFGDGAPRRLDFSLSLKRVDDSMMTEISDDIMSLL
ncbi:phage tail protein [Glaesserella parasuis]|uniref:phage tail protein n=1 Tax=Glaesserella parasuis TaxID=738 RepID=UPI0013DE9957|nr:phage tail protein [Glaesserella parasuis]MDD2170682.1 phage tail protein [Glaesserella parasuis]MDP0406746.1 phage tail protein [Glaesserella parasuis]QIE71702.1 phage tail protein [Glaesserella parasuis]